MRLCREHVFSDHSVGWRRRGRQLSSMSSHRAIQSHISETRVWHSHRLGVTGSLASPSRHAPISRLVHNDMCCGLIIPTPFHDSIERGQKEKTTSHHIACTRIYPPTPSHPSPSGPAVGPGWRTSSNRRLPPATSAATTSILRFSAQRRIFWACGGCATVRPWPRFKLPALQSCRQS
jgi:hypothetical protein